MAGNFSFHQLNPPQREAVKTIRGPVLILAGAGTGKTRTITARIANMIDCGIDPSTILGVTFTNKAALEMRERVAGMVSKKASAEITLCTFHSLCLRFLREDIELLGYKKNFSIYTQGEQISLVRKLIGKLAAKEEKLDPNQAQSMISRAKNTGDEHAGEPDSLIAEIHRHYQRELKTLNAVDFDDLMILALKLLKENAVVREKWQERFQHIMVDEFQDTNKLQMDLLKQIVGPEHNICVVGDDDQSIYGWRGADITNILDFERHFKNPKIIKLEENYRSTTPILHTANSLIKNNMGRRPKSLWTPKAGGNPVRVVCMEEDSQEATFIAEEIWSSQRNQQCPWEDYAILIRTNTQSQKIETELRRLKIPYRIVGTKSFFDRREVKEVLAYLSVLANPDDDVNLLRVINSPPRGIGDTTVNLALEHSIRTKTSLWVALNDLECLAQFSERARTALLKFVKLIEDFRSHAMNLSTHLGSMIEQLLREIEYEEYLNRSSKTTEEAEGRRAGMKEICSQVHRFQDKRGRKTLADFLDQVALMGDDEEKDDITKKQGVCLITLHASKGLEFPIVYLIGLEEGVLPHKRSLEEGTRDEERRLFYVGITRAMRELTITWCSGRKRYGVIEPRYPSSFLAELDRLHVEETSFEQISKKPVTQEATASLFAQLKAALKQPSES